jgi:hypothetical protein
MAMRMDKQADFGAAGGAQMNRARAAPMQKAMIAEAAPAPAAPPNRMEPEEDAIVADGESPEDDF